MAVKDCFSYTQRRFDKELKKIKRTHERSQVFKLEQANIENPIEFWKSIAKLGKKTAKIPMEIEREDGTICDDLNEVLNKWKEDFASLFTSSESYNQEQRQFVEDIKSGNLNKE